MKKNYIGISRDHSGSMGMLRNPALKDYNSNIDSIKANNAKEKQDTIVSVVSCGINSGVQRETVLSSVNALQGLSHYVADGQTPLFDSIGDLIEQFESVPDRNDPDVSFLIVAITDGAENASRNWPARRLAEKIRQLQSTDRWTFAFRVPRGYAQTLTNMGIPAGNILEWDQTESGFKEATTQTDTAYQTFYAARSAGARATKAFFSTNMAGVSKNTVKSKLVNISADVQFFNVRPQEDGQQIRAFVEQRLRNKELQKGQAFYQLMKPEKEVQDYKQIAIRDKTSGDVYSGAAARQLLGLPYSGSVKIVPGNHGQYDIFVQSTSVNRKLVAGTQVMYWEAAAVHPSMQTKGLSWDRTTA